MGPGGSRTNDDCDCHLQLALRHSRDRHFCVYDHRESTGQTRSALIRNPWREIRLPKKNPLVKLN